MTIPPESSRESQTIIDDVALVQATTGLTIDEILDDPHRAVLRLEHGVHQREGEELWDFARECANQRNVMDDEWQARLPLEAEVLPSGERVVRVGQLDALAELAGLTRDQLLFDVPVGSEDGFNRFVVLEAVERIIQAQAM